MDNETYVDALRRELGSAVARKALRAEVEAIRGELQRLGVELPVETTGAKSAAKRVRKTAAAGE